MFGWNWPMGLLYENSSCIKLNSNVASIFKMISLNHATHTYTVNGTPFISVTTLISQWFAKFDADKTLAKMNKSNYPGMTNEEIKEQWLKKGKDASDKGTELHESIEAYMNGTPKPLDTKEYQYFLDFMEIEKPETFHAEWCVFHEPTKLIGTIDYVATSPDGLNLYDWKRSEDLSKHYGYCILPELQHLPDSKYWKYTIQLNLYKFLLEEMGHKVNKMYIVCLHPTNLSYKKIEVSKLDVKTIVKKYREGTCGDGL